MTAINHTNPVTQQEWNRVLETPSSVKKYLNKRVDILTDELQDIQPQYEKTTVLHRIKWVAQILYHTARVIFYSLGKVFATIIRSKTLLRKCSLQFYDATCRIGSRVLSFSCHRELLIATHSGHDFSRSKISNYQDLIYDGKPFDVSNTTGNCAGVQRLFTLLYLKGRIKFSEMDAGDLIRKIAQLLSKGVHPESAILQQLQCSQMNRELFSELSEECLKLSQIEPEHRKLSFIYFQKPETQDDIPPSIEKLRKLDLHRPYFLTTRSNLVSVLHATALIRTGEDEFYSFDSLRGLTFFSGVEKMEKLVRLWDYGPRTRGEKKLIQAYTKTLDDHIVDFKKRYNVSAENALILDEVDTMMKQGILFDEIIDTIRKKNSDISICDSNLILIYFQDRKKIEAICSISQIAPSMEVVLSPYSDEIINLN